MINVKIPTTQELVEIALEAHELFDRLKADSDIPQLAAACTSEAVDTWCHDNRAPLSAVSLSVWTATCRTLAVYAEAELDCREQAEAQAEAELAEAIEHGDVTPDGDWISYPTYRSV